MYQNSIEMVLSLRKFSSEIKVEFRAYQVTALRVYMPSVE